MEIDSKRCDVPFQMDWNSSDPAKPLKTIAPDEAVERIAFDHDPTRRNYEQTQD